MKLTAINVEDCYAVFISSAFFPICVFHVASLKSGHVSLFHFSAV